MLQAQRSSNPTATSHTNAEGGNEPWGQVQTVLAAAMNVAQAVAAGPAGDAVLLSKPGVLQLLTVPELHQLLLITAAWLTGLLHQQKQGVAAVHTASVVRSLSNSSAAAAYSLDNSSSSSTIQVAPHHVKVLELLGAPALDPRKHSDPASCKEAIAFCSAVLHSLDVMLPAVLKAAGICLEVTSAPSQFTASRHISAADGAVSCFVAWQMLDRDQVPASSSCGFGSWRELMPALTRMLIAVVQLGPCFDARQSALTLLMPVVRQDMRVWQQPAGAAVVGELVMQLGPAVLHAHQQQQQQSQADAKNCQFALWYWAVTLMNTVGAGGCCRGASLHLLLASITCSMQHVTQFISRACSPAVLIKIYLILSNTNIKRRFISCFHGQVLTPLCPTVSTTSCTCGKLYKHSTCAPSCSPRSQPQLGHQTLQPLLQVPIPAAWQQRTRVTIVTAAKQTRT
jgi:hypothetical protein